MNEGSVDSHQLTTQASARGALLGAACGDAVGAPFEGAATVSASHLMSWTSSDAPLRYTDDTAMTLVLAHHLLSTGGTIDETRLVREFAREWHSDTTRGYGAAPPRIFRAVLAGVHWATVASSAFGGTGSWGNGGAMRVAPVALLPHPIDQRVSLARRQAAVTHAHALAQDGAALQCAAIAHAAASAGKPLEPADFLTTISEHLGTPEFLDAIATLRVLLVSAATPMEFAARLGTDATALGSVPTAIALFLQASDDLEAALASAVLPGGDTDTVASMVGALAGARMGQDGIPNRWVRRLERHEEITELADQLAAIPTP